MVPVSTPTDESASAQATPPKLLVPNHVAVGPVIDMDAFNQILELDDEGTHKYSMDIMVAYFTQATTTFAAMDKALAEKNLPALADLAHFLMGSSAALGAAQVQASCGRMEEAATDAPLQEIRALLGVVKDEYADAERWLRKWYADRGESFDHPADADADAGRGADLAEVEPEPGGEL
ncbi:signal transduction histidine kinase [Mycena sp. CBHHK59/15]|nr:signal transduction histidine kinase [Mycena sp. CBHHK59/15]